jgi:hypothetical protein
MTWVLYISILFGGEPEVSFQVVMPNETECRRAEADSEFVARATGLVGLDLRLTCRAVPKSIDEQLI